MRARGWIAAALLAGLTCLPGSAAAAELAGAAALARQGPAPAPAPGEATGEARKAAEALFGRYQDLEHNFDPALVDLYADDAHIVSHIIVPGQKTTVRDWNGSQYKELLKRALAKAKEKKQDLNYYTGAVYLREGARVRIRVTRYAEMQKAVSPVELLVGPDRTGTWRVYEELSESHPQLHPAGATPAPPPATGH